MYGNKSIKYKSDGTKYKDFYYYSCKHRRMTRGHKCDFKKQINEEVLDSAVAETISRLVSNRKFSDIMRKKINMKVDTSEVDQEIAAYEKELRKCYGTRDHLSEDIDNLDPDDRHYMRMKTDLNNRMYKMYDKIDSIENDLLEARAKKAAIEADKITGDNIYKALVFFDKLYENMNDHEKHQFMGSLIDEIQIHKEQQPNGQWLKAIKFKLPVIDEELNLGLDNDAQNESCCLLVKR